MVQPFRPAEVHGQRCCERAATGLAASDVLSNARELDNQSGKLRHAVDEFLVKVRAA